MQAQLSNACLARARAPHHGLSGHGIAALAAGGPLARVDTVQKRAVALVPEDDGGAKIAIHLYSERW